MEAIRDVPVSPGRGGVVKVRLGDLADTLGGTVRGDRDRWIHSVAGLEDAGPESISFLTHSGYGAAAKTTAAGALVVERADDQLTADLLICDNPALAVARILELFHPAPEQTHAIHPTAAIDDAARVAPEASVGAFSVIGAETVVEAGARIHAHVTIGRDCRVGRDAVLHPQVVLYDRCEVGDRSIIHSGTVIGADGFGYVPAEGALVKVLQVGTVVIESDVEIGANSAVDRATVATTRVGSGTKIDNLVQVGHNVQIGRSCILCGQTGISGSVVLEDGVVMGGQTGASGHIRLGAGSQVAGKSAVFKSVPAGKTVGGSPAQDIGDWRRQVALLRRLDSFRKRLRKLEDELSSHLAEADDP